MLKIFILIGCRRGPTYFQLLRLQLKTLKQKQLTSSMVRGGMLVEAKQ